MKRQTTKGEAIPRILLKALLPACIAWLAACASLPGQSGGAPPAGGEGSQDVAAVPSFSPGPDPPVLFTLYKPGAKLNRNWLGLNEYFPVHYWYEDILYRFGLHLRLSLEEKTLILGGLLFNLDFEKPVRLVVDRYAGGAPLEVQLQLVEARPGTSVLLEANVDPDTRRPIPEDKLLFQGYRQLYVLSRSALVSARELYPLHSPAQAASETAARQPARRYIFDGDPDNDEEAERLLIFASRNAVDAAQRLRSRLSLAQLYASVGRFNRAELALASARLLLQQELTNRQDLREEFRLTSEELVITRALKALGSQPLELGIPAL